MAMAKWPAVDSRAATPHIRSLRRRVGAGDRRPRRDRGLGHGEGPELRAHDGGHPTGGLRLARRRSGYPSSSTANPETNYPNYDPRYEVPRGEIATVSGASNHTGLEIMQTGVSAADGAAIAVGAMWLYRRRHAPATSHQP
jgi:hypothetical protein